MSRRCTHGTRGPDAAPRSRTRLLLIGAVAAFALLGAWSSVLGPAGAQTATDPDVLVDPYTGTGPVVGGIVVRQIPTTTTVPDEPPPPPSAPSGPPTVAAPAPGIVDLPDIVDPSDRSTLAAAIPTISELSWGLRHVATNFSFVLLLLLLLGLPAELLNSTLKEHYGAIAVGQRLPQGWRAVSNAINSLPNPLLLVGFGVVGALIYGQLDPSFGWNAPSLRLVGGLTAALVVVTGVFEALRIPYFRRTTGRDAHLRMYPLALVAAVFLVAFSRLFGFEPGFIFGITCGLALSSEINDIDDGRSIAFASGGLLVLAFGSWLAWTPVADAAAGTDPSSVTLFFDVMLSTLWVTGLQAVLFGLLPMRFLPGEKVMQWSRPGWIAIYGTALLLFVTAIVHPSSQAWSGTSQAMFWTILAVLAVITIIAIGVWAWFRYVVPRRAASE